MSDDRKAKAHDDAAGNDPPVDQVIAEFIRRRDAGEPVDVDSLCAARPELADALRSYADGEAMLREMALNDSVAGGSALAETVRPGAARDTDTSLTGRTFGNYRVIRQLGQGGMGAVYLAEDVTLERNVALKIPRFTQADGPDARERFFREARSAAALSHPHICPVFHADESGGTPYIAMALIDGQPLSRFIGTDEFRDPRRVAEIIRNVCDALQHAHENGIIHRDLKPGNIMLDQSGQPIVTDFGLARRLVANQESRITQEGQLLGTPAYMSPEQIAGNADQVTRSTDIYALGVVLFELLTGCLPFQGSVPEVIAGALKSKPPRPSSLQADVDPVMETLCLQMLQKKAERRPASMQDVSQRLQKWLGQRSPESQSDQTAAKEIQHELTAERQRIEKLLRAGKFEAGLKRLQRLARRKEPAAAEFREWAIEQIPRVKARPAQARRNEPEMLKMAQDWMAKHDYQQAIQILRSIPDLFRSEKAEELLHEATELQEEADDLLLDLKKCVKDRIYDGIDDNLNRLLVLKPGNHFAKNLQRKLQSYRGGRGKGRPYRFDKQGRLLAINEDNFWTRAMLLSAVVGLSVFGLMTWAITIYLKNDDQTIAVQIDEDWLNEQGGELTLDVDGDEHTLTASGLDLEVSLGKHGFSVRQGDAVVHNPQTFTIEKEGRQVLHIDAQGMSVGRAPPTNESIANRHAEGGQSPPDLTAAPEFEFQQLLSYDFTDLAGQKLNTGGLVLTGRGAEAYLSMGRYLYKFTEDETSHPVQLSDKGGAYDIDITSDGRYVALARAYGRVEIWSTTTWEMKHRLEFTDNTGQATMVEISPDGQWVGAVMMRGRAAIWELESGRLVTEIPIESDSSWTLRPAFSPDSQKMIVVGQNGKGRKIYEIDVDSGDSDIKLCDAVSGHGDIVIGSDDRAVIASHPNGPLYLVNSRTWQDARIIGSCGDQKALAWSPDSTLLASANPKDQGLALYDGTNCKWLKNIALDGLDIEDVAFSRDSRTFAVSGLVTRSDVEGPVPAIRVWRLSEKSEGGHSPPELTDPNMTENQLTDTVSETKYAISLDGLENAGGVDVNSLLYNDKHPITLEAWVKLPLESSQWHAPLSWFTENYDERGNKVFKGVYFKADYDSKTAMHQWHLHINQENIGTGVAARAGGWSHVALVVKDTELRFFVDGRLVYDHQLEKSMRQPDMPFLVGGVYAVEEQSKDLRPPRYVSFYHSFKGQLDEIRVSKVARYTGDFTPSIHLEVDNGTLALFHCDEGSGERLIDSSGNNNHGVVRNVKWVTVDDANKLEAITQTVRTSQNEAKATPKPAVPKHNRPPREPQLNPEFAKAHRGELLAHYRFDGNLIESAGRGSRILTLKQPAFRQNALQLDGAYAPAGPVSRGLPRDLAAFSVPSLDSRKFTVVLRARVESTPGRPYLIGGNLNRWFCFERNDDGTLRVGMDSWAWRHDFKSPIIERDRWYVLSCGVDLKARKCVVSVDGEVTGSVTIPSSVKLDSSPWQNSVVKIEQKAFTMTNSLHGESFNGKLDEVMVYDHLLLVSDLNQLIKR